MKRTTSLLKTWWCSGVLSNQRSFAEQPTAKLAASVNCFCQRSHNCGELRLAHVGKTVELYGWLEFNRYNRFLVIRDSYGSVQATVPDGKVDAFRDLITSTPNESVVRVQGVVQDRGRNRTTKMETGDVEVEITELDVLNTAPSALPVFSSEMLDNESTEATRLSYRYLDLRSKRMQHNLRLRSKIIHAMRCFLVNSCHFVDVETPTLSQWTPGGAAEFVVPAPKPNTGQFYTLPQSPQIYKQLLMCGGIDRYFQVAKCYRNEGAKTDRQPEFTQVDLEMSFVTQEDIINLVETMIVESWPENLAEHKPKAPFPRISFRESMEKYGSDKPDLRQIGGRPFEFLWVVNFPLFTRTVGNRSGEVSLESTHHPFTAPVREHLDDLRMGRNLTDITAQHYDLVMNGVELGGGSIRIHDASLQRHVFNNILHLPTDTLEHFLKALEYGAPPHGGFALGLDRYVALLAEESYRFMSNTSDKRQKKVAKSDKNQRNLGQAHEFVASIRDVIAFPKSKNGRCLAMGAPTHLPAVAYRDYGIALVADDEKKADKVEKV